MVNVLLTIKVFPFWKHLVFTRTVRFGHSFGLQGLNEKFTPFAL